MPRDVAERLARDRQQLRDDLDRQAPVAAASSGTETSTSTAAVAAQLGREVPEAIGQAARLEEGRTQAEDEVADVADDRVQRIDGLVDATRGLVGLGSSTSSGHVVEGERLRVDGLDHAVVEVAADPVALVHDRQPPNLVVESRVLDRDPGVEGEHLDHGLVVLAELGALRACS